jgi:hypothetical protein
MKITNTPYPHSLWSPAFATSAHIVTDDYEIHSVVEGVKSVKYYDDGYGPLWRVAVACGNFYHNVCAIRARGLAEAHEIWEDEFATSSDPDDYPTAPWEEDSTEWEYFEEENAMRPNGGHRKDGGHYQKEHDMQISEAQSSNRSYWANISIIVSVRN